MLQNAAKVAEVSLVRVAGGQRRPVDHKEIRQRQQQASAQREALHPAEALDEHDPGAGGQASEQAPQVGCIAEGHAGAGTVAEDQLRLIPPHQIAAPEKRPQRGEDTAKPGLANAAATRHLHEFRASCYRCWQALP